MEFTATRQDSKRAGGNRQCSGKDRRISSLFPADAAAELPVPGESATLTQLPPSHRLPFPALDWREQALTLIENDLCAERPISNEKRYDSIGTAPAGIVGVGLRSDPGALSIGAFGVPTALRK